MVAEVCTNSIFPIVIEWMKPGGQQIQKPEDSPSHGGFVIGKEVTTQPIDVERTTATRKGQQLLVLTRRTEADILSSNLQKPLQTIANTCNTMLHTLTNSGNDHSKVRVCYTLLSFTVDL